MKKIYVLNSNITIPDESQSLLLINEELERAYIFKNTELDIIRLIDGKRTADEISIILGKKYTLTSQEIIKNDVIEYLDQLNKIGICKIYENNE